MHTTAYASLRPWTEPAIIKVATLPYYAPTVETKPPAAFRYRCINFKTTLMYIMRARDHEAHACFFPNLETWKNKDESKNKEQRYDEEMIREAKRSEVEDEIRKQVDSIMREELDLLKIVMNGTYNTIIGSLTNETFQL